MYFVGRRCLLGLVAMMCFGPAWAAPASATGNSAVASSTARASQEEDANARVIRRALEARYPRITIADVQPSAVPGIYEVFTGYTIVYTDRTGDHLFVGRLIDTQSKRDLSEERLDVYSGIEFDKLPFKQAIRIVKGNGSRQLAIFEDPNCPYCQDLEHSLASMTDLTEYVFLFPLEDLHPGATNHAHLIWCARDRAAAWTAWMQQRVLPPATPCQDDPLAANRQLALSMHINATPTLFLANGHRIRGTLPLAQLQKVLAEDAATTRTAARATAGSTLRVSAATQTRNSPHL